MSSLLEIYSRLDSSKSTLHPTEPTYNAIFRPVADSGGVRGVQMHPPLASNDYAGVACSNNNQA